MRKAHNFKWNEGAIRKAARAFSTRSEFERHEASAVNAARQRHSLKLGSDPKYSGFNGASEFRAFNASALAAAMQIICINT